MGPEQLAADGDFAALPLAVVQRIDELADEFEAAWRSGETPSPDSFIRQLDDASDEARAALTTHLAQLHTELNLRRLGGPTDESPVAGGTAMPSRAIPVGDQPVTVGEYRLLSQLGSGGMGVVYKAMHARLDRLVAIKFPRFAAVLDPRSAARFLREAKLIGRLHHPHIVLALDAGESPYGPFLVTEFIDGETVEALVRRTGPLPLPTAVTLIVQAASALEYAHAQDVVHRDVKPSNLLLDGDGALRVVDFGLAKLLADDRRALGATPSVDRTECGAFLGTVGYAAPEQLQPDQPVDHRADVYALGCVLYFMLTGETLHKGTLVDRVLAGRRSKAGSLRLYRDDAPPQFEKTWRRMVAAAPEDRFSSMTAAAAALQSALDDPPAVHGGARFRRRLAIAAIPLAALGALIAWKSDFPDFSESKHDSPAGPPPPLAVAPFAAGQAADYQRLWAMYVRKPVRVKNRIGMPLVLIPPGEFQMGAADGASFEPTPPVGDWRFREPETLSREHRPQHRVVLTKPVYFGATEVTHGQFREFADATGYETDAERNGGWGREDKGWVKRPGYSWKNMGQRVSGDRHPVINVTWNDAAALCAWLTKNDDLGVYRLPTEAEWEFACRAGSATAYSFGNDAAELVDHGWFTLNSEGRFRPVASKRANPFGLYDLYGNRQEWCQDAYAIDFYASSPLRDPVSETGGERVMRGGAHTDLASICTSARRWSQPADDPGAAGIRVACELRDVP